MLPKEKIEISDEEIKQDDQERAEVETHASRSRDEVKKIFIDQATEDGLDLEDESVKKFIERQTDREIANSKRLSKTIGQKIKYRDLATKPGDKKEEEKGEKSPIEQVQEVLLKKALKKKLGSYVEKCKEKNLTAEQIHESLKKHFSCNEDDVEVSDMEERLDAAFGIAFPDVYTEEIRREERKKFGDEDIPEEEHSSGAGAPKSGRKLFPKSVPITDWYKPKK